MNALLSEALSKVESQSIRDWVQTPHNLPLWEKIAAGWKKDADWLAAYIVATAMGM